MFDQEQALSATEKKNEYIAYGVTATIILGGLTWANQDEAHPNWGLLGMTAFFFLLSVTCCFNRAFKINDQGRCVSDFSLFRSLGRKSVYREIPAMNEGASNQEGAVTSDIENQNPLTPKN